MIKGIVKEVGKGILQDKVESLSEEHKDTNLTANVIHNGMGLFEFLSTRSLYMWLFIIGSIINFFLCGFIFKLVLDSYFWGAFGSIFSIYVDYRIIKHIIKKTYKTIKQEVLTTTSLVKDKVQK